MVLPTRASALTALVVALAAVAVTAWGLSTLHRNESDARDAETRVVALRLDVVRMLDIPWGASPDETDDPEAVRDELLGAEEGVLGEIDALSRTPGLPARDRFLGHFREAVDALEEIWRAMATGDDDATGRPSEVSARQMYKADAVLQRAAETYQRDADRSATQERLGALALVGLLFLAFAVYFVRSSRDRDHRARVAADLEVARDDALAASRAKSMFLANMSHEIRTPLTSVLAAAELLEDTPLDDTQRRLLGTMRRAGRQLKGLVDEVLDFSRIEAGEVRLVSEPFDLRAMVDDLADGYTRPAGAGRAPVRFDLQVDPDAPATIVGDRVRVVQVVGNLLDNAFKFTEEGCVSLTVRPSHPDFDGVEFVVEDTGPGIPVELQASIFESFHQVDGSATRHHGGSGLGLAIVKELTDLMGGTVAVDSRPGAGSTFVVRVPTRPAAAPEG